MVVGGDGAEEGGDGGDVEEDYGGCDDYCV